MSSINVNLTSPCYFIEEFIKIYLVYIHWKTDVQAEIPRQSLIYFSFICVFEHFVKIIFYYKL